MIPWTPRSPEPCPVCGKPAPCHDWSEVDIGVGTQTFNHSFMCPIHGEFAWNEGAPVGSPPIMRDWPPHIEGTITRFEDGEMDVDVSEKP
jgi:hypothetical protein